MIHEHLRLLQLLYFLGEGTSRFLLLHKATKDETYLLGVLE